MIDLTKNIFNPSPFGIVEYKRSLWLEFVIATSDKAVSFVQMHEATSKDIAT